MARVKATCPSCKAELAIELPKFEVPKEADPKKEEPTDMSDFCPTCHQPHNGVQDLKMKLELTDRDHKSEIDKMSEKLNAALAMANKPPPEPKVDDLCQKYGLCPIANLNAAQTAAAEASKKAEEVAKKAAQEAEAAAAQIEKLKGQHDELTEDWLTSQESCPTCGPHLQSYLEKKIKAGGYVKPEPAPATPAAAAAAPKVDCFGMPLD